MFRALLIAMAVGAVPTAAVAGQLVLAPTSVIGSSGFYTACCTFQPGNIFDQQTGTVTETFGGGYWLNPDNGPADAYITIDLGGKYSLDALTLFNTHNGPFADRGTGNFTIQASNSVADSGGGNFVLTGAVNLLSATLNPETSGNPAAQTFNATGLYRYLSFNPTSVAVGGSPCCGANVYGLNELRISVVPEPASWALMIAGFAMTGTVLRRRQAVIAA